MGLMTNTMTYKVLILGALGLFLYFRSDEAINIIASFGETVLNGIISVANAIVNGIVDILTTIINSIVSFVKNAIKKILPW